MATIIKTIKDKLGNIILPRTKSIAVTMEDGSQVETAINSKQAIGNYLIPTNEIITNPIPRDADTLTGYTPTTLPVSTLTQTSINTRLAKTTNITTIDDTGIADGEIMVANLTAKKIETSNVNISEVAKLTPVATFTLTTNAEIVVSAYDIGTDTITSVAHGLLNDDRIYPTLNNTEYAKYIRQLIIGGMNTNAVYYVVNKTNDTFQISLTSGGAVIDLTTLGTTDLTKWHFEKGMPSSIALSSLPASKKYRIKAWLKTCDGTGFYIMPTTWVVQAWSTFTAYGYPSVDPIGAGANLYLDVELSSAPILSQRIFKHSYYPSTTNTGEIVISNTDVVRLSYYTSLLNTDITSIIVGNASQRFLNGSKIEVYNL